MAYPPPPGTSRSNTNSPHPSLPARPPQAGSTSGGFKPAFKPAFTPPQVAASYSSSSSSQYGGASTSRAPGQYAAPPSYSQPPSSGMSTPSYSAQQSSYQYPQQSAGYAQSSSYNAPPTTTFGAAPQIRNPFPMPGTAQAGAGHESFDPEMAAQIAQWQSAYGGGRDSSAASGPAVTAGPTAGPSAYPTGADTSSSAATSGPQQPDKSKTVAREGGGKKWTDDTLLEWDPSHLRLFVGNLAGETTDDSLLKAFARWSSVQKARVIRDKRTSKSKGYGFVSFSDADDFFQAAKEMNGKYIQSHPVVVRKANTEIKVTNNNKGKNHKGKGNKNKSGNGGGGAGGSYEPGLGPVHSGGVTKPGQKTKNGLKLLG
ncbi:RNA-binding protein [Plectosphaerella plurivora]|uniref:RNA-binding protein n=1 Tax=Plectosphaerella plurivora TaxID=936078 RepID=A0A9P8V9Z8_9PEZI|nr:RNA-binding protein [Plectosphaerella plurivora]